MASIAPKSQPKTKRGIARREMILRAAEKVFGERGFAASTIADLAREANTALGTYYIYFDSKNAVFRELVLEMGVLTRRVMADAVEGAPNRLEAERLGLRAFLGFVAERPALYRIVEEARFVDPEAYRDYFTQFGAAYRDQLERAEAAGEIRKGDAEVRAWALMGVAKNLGDRFALNGGEDLDRIADEGFDLIKNGLAP
ncbi:TetR/AcrR family transcriptional regulator [Tropicibacter sp. R15_0]|uniref:TetR/AcrR family transcriptional regulator n=1 Tax=Tropicibacter sp. R15_0 TaxID=2821101 RepID=UPI001ADB4B37|nr:TetR/AcrR family transcriptional regulator [Tropicibacter sp. R15_0]MBO9467910.1 TetR/AcrR family transcriptional regulator [Tropicibacter sp. R15_0]